MIRPGWWKQRSIEFNSQRLQRNTAFPKVEQIKKSIKLEKKHWSDHRELALMYLLISCQRLWGTEPVTFGKYGRRVRREAGCDGLNLFTKGEYHSFVTELTVKTSATTSQQLLVHVVWWFCFTGWESNYTSDNLLILRSHIPGNLRESLQNVLSPVDLQRVNLASFCVSSRWN